MLVSAPHPLAQQVAAMRADLRAEAERRTAQAGVVATLHVLILACLTRLLARLGDMIDRWQSGQGAPATRTSAQPRPPRTAIPAPRQDGRVRAIGAQPQHLLNVPATQATFPAAPAATFADAPRAAREAPESVAAPPALPDAQASPPAPLRPPRRQKNHRAGPVDPRRFCYDI